MHSLQPPSSAQRPGASPNRLTLSVQRSFWRLLALGIQGSPSPHTRNRPAAPGGPEGLVPPARKTSCSAQTFLDCARGPGAPVGRGQRLRQASAQTSRGPTMKSVQKQWLEVVGAYQYVLTFLFLGPFFSLLIFFLLFTSFWWVSVLYLVWLYLDWDTPKQGGRRFEWIRNLAMWRHVRDYYPVKLVKTAELPPDRNYVLSVHPHGIMCVGAFCNFSTDVTGFSKKFPGIQTSMTGLGVLFHLPVYREYLMSYGLRPVSRQSLDFILSQPQRGQAVIIMVGGAQESLYAVPGKHCLILRNRKGFVRLALRHGASLVPVYSFGENDIFKFKAFATNSWQYLCQITFKRIMGFSPCIFWGQGLFSANSWGLLPFARPITTVVGRPIPVPQRLDPTEEEVDHYHMLFMEALEQLFEDHKESCGVPASTHLTFI
uniref:Acyltransferase n=2 Tax=Mustela putorius furo TaxID=9669 RepID=M3YWQ7_MUSPF